MMATKLYQKRSAVHRITVRGTDGTERVYTLRDGTLVVGRDPASGICLQDAQVSWQHAVLSDDGGACVIEDLGSSNGTFVGAERIQRQVLNAGEIVRIAGEKSNGPAGPSGGAATPACAAARASGTSSAALCQAVAVHAATIKARPAHATR